MQRAVWAPRESRRRSGREELASSFRTAAVWGLLRLSGPQTSILTGVEAYITTNIIWKYIRSI